jgi:hypothetical protein
MVHVTLPGVFIVGRYVVQNSSHGGLCYCRNLQILLPHINHKYLFKNYFEWKISAIERKKRLSFEHLRKYNLNLLLQKKLRVCRQIFLIPSGYSVSSGKFLGEEKKTLYVSGAPRAGVKYQGKVTSQLHEVTDPLSPFITLLWNNST